MLTSNLDAGAISRSGLYRSTATGSGMRGLPAPCCSDCAGLGDDSAAAGATGGVPRWLFLWALGLGALASGILIYDRFKPKARRRPRVGSQRIYYTPSQSGRVLQGGERRGERRTMQLPTETMADVVFGRRT